MSGELQKELSAAELQALLALEPKTPDQGIPLPGYTLDIDLARLRAALLMVDTLSVSLADNNEQAAATADNACEAAEEAKLEAARATAKS